MSLASRLSSLSSALFTGDFGSAHIILPLGSVRSSVIVTALPRPQFASSLAKYADTLVASSFSASKTRIYYPTSPTAAKQLITLLSQHDLTTPGSFDPALTLPEIPSQVILHEPSAFFRNEPQSSMSSYLDLITTFIAAVASLRNRNLGLISLMVFDSDLVHLELPILKPPTPSYLFHPDHEDDPQASTSIRKYSVYALVRRYFEWIGQFHVYPSASADNEMPPSRRRLELLRAGSTSTEAEWHEWTGEVLNIGL